MLFLGDTHANEECIVSSIRLADGKEIVQVGDLGMGFFNNAPVLPRNFSFIRGNHDNPNLCRAHPNYIGDWFYDDKTSILYISGAESIDKKFRILGYDVWEDEELSFKTMNNILDEMKGKTVKTVVSHDCPREVFNFSSRTSQFLQSIFEWKRPTTWVFGHHHKSMDFVLNNTRFVGIGEFELKDIFVENN